MKCGPGFKKGIGFKQIGVGTRNLVTNYVPNSSFIPNYLLATSRKNDITNVPNSNYNYETSKRGCTYVAVSDAQIYMSTPLLDVSLFKKLKVTAYTVEKDTQYHTDYVTISIASDFIPGDYRGGTSVIPRATYISSQTFQNGTITIEFDVSARNSVYLVGEFYFNNGVLGASGSKDFQFVNVTLE